MNDLETVEERLRRRRARVVNLYIEHHNSRPTNETPDEKAFSDLVDMLLNGKGWGLDIALAIVREVLYEQR